MLPESSVDMRPWHGVLAVLGTPATVIDGHTFQVDPPEPGHQSYADLPVPLYATAVCDDHTTPFVVGTITSVSVVDDQLRAVGLVALDTLRIVRPDWADTLHDGEPQPVAVVLATGKQHMEHHAIDPCVHVARSWRLGAGELVDHLYWPTSHIRLSA